MLKKLIKNILKRNGYELYRRNFYDFNDLNALGKIYPRNSKITIFDVGANAGQTVKRFKEFWPNSIIHSFEPDPDVFMKLEENCRKYSNVKLHNVGLGEKIEVKKFYKMVDSGSSSFIPINKNSNTYNILNRKENIKHHNVSTPKSNSEKVVNCPITTIDEFCTKNDINQIHLLKMDVQGYEPMVLKGGRHMLSQNNVNLILTEIMLTDYYAQRGSFSDIENQIKHQNFVLYDIPYLARVPDENEQRLFFIDAIYANTEKFEGI